MADTKTKATVEIVNDEVQAENATAPVEEIAATEIRDCTSSLITTRTQETESEWTRTEIREYIGWLLSGAAIRRLRAV